MFIKRGMEVRAFNGAGAGRVVAIDRKYNVVAVEFEDLASGQKTYSEFTVAQLRHKLTGRPLQMHKIMLARYMMATLVFGAVYYFYWEQIMATIFGLPGLGEIAQDWWLIWTKKWLTLSRSQIPLYKAVSAITMILPMLWLSANHLRKASDEKWAKKWRQAKAAQKYESSLY